MSWANGIKKGIPVFPESLSCFLKAETAAHMVGFQKAIAPALSWWRKQRVQIFSRVIVNVVEKREMFFQPADQVYAWAQSAHALPMKASTESR